MQATQKQINFALALMGKAGYSTRFMNRGHKALGATMRQRSGSVRDWLASMSRSEISALIDQLKAETTADEPVAAAPTADVLDYTQVFRILCKEEQGWVRTSSSPYTFEKTVGANKVMIMAAGKTWVASKVNGEFAEDICQDSLPQAFAAAEAALVSATVVAAREPREVGDSQAVFAFMV